MKVVNSALCSLYRDPHSRNHGWSRLLHVVDGFLHLYTTLQLQQSEQYVNICIKPYDKPVSR